MEGHWFESQLQKNRKPTHWKHWKHRKTGNPGGIELRVKISLSKILNNPKDAPDVQLAPCVAAAAISKGPAMSWQLIQGVPSPLE